MKKLLLLLAVVFTLVFAACGKEEGAKETAKATEEKGAKVGLVLSTGGLGDKSFNDAAHKGLMQAKDELGADVKFVEPSQVSDFEEFLRQFGEANYDLVIGIGFQMADALKAVATEYPEVKFVMIDEPIELANIKSIVFDEAEGSFLAGALAGMMTEKKQLGFIGGLDVPLIKSFGNGFFAGAKYVDPSIKTVDAYIGGNNPFNDPVKGKSIAESMADNGADIIFHAAAGSGAGLFEILKDRNIMAVGVDSNQDDEVPGYILTSMVKQVDVAVFEAIKSLGDGSFKAGVEKLGVASGGVGITDLKNTKDKIGEENLKKLEEIKQKIESGEIVVADEMKK